MQPVVRVPKQQREDTNHAYHTYHNETHKALLLFSAKTTFAAKSCTRSRTGPRSLLLLSESCHLECWEDPLWTLLLGCRFWSSKNRAKIRLAACSCWGKWWLRSWKRHWRYQPSHWFVLTFEKSLRCSQSQTYLATTQLLRRRRSLCLDTWLYWSRCPVACG